MSTWEWEEAMEEGHTLAWHHRASQVSRDWPYLDPFDTQMWSENGWKKIILYCNISFLNDFYNNKKIL
jgi:hypothetical protein